MRFVFLVLSSIFGCTADDMKTSSPESRDDPVIPEPVETYYGFVEEHRLPAPIQAFAVDSAGAFYLASEDRIFHYNSSGEADDWPLPISGEPLLLAVAADNEEYLFAYIKGKGLWRSPISTKEWQLVANGLSAPLLSTLSPGAQPIPFRLIQGRDQRLWLAAIGGLYVSDDMGLTWEAQNTAQSGNVNPIFVDVAVANDKVIAVSMLPEAMIPQSYAGILSGQIFSSTDGGVTWQDGGLDFPSFYASSVAIDENGSVYIGTLDQGVLQQTNEGWQSIEGPSDVISLEFSQGGLSVGSASRGLWRWFDGAWSQTGAGGAVSVLDEYGVTFDGGIYILQPVEQSEALSEQAGNVHIAVSFHVNYYHSYRGDSPTDDGFGMDMDVIRNTLDWLDANPSVPANWDMDNAFSTDDWMVEYSPDILQRISQRVADGKDEIRLMSWNNGAMSASTKEEFDAAVTLGVESNLHAFGTMAYGVQPQECMFTPDHLGWYPEHAIDWVTLFYSATGFTALRHDIELSNESLYNPIELVDPILGHSMIAVPAYHHADLLEHGGLVGWARQISANYAGDSLLLIHFDADAESWERFDQEIAAVQELDFVQWTTISDYVEGHEPVSSHTFHGDVADGTGDGFQSWAEKNYNHEHFTQVALARRKAHVARFLAVDGVEQQLEEALIPRLLALSTTNYGLAAPYLHQDRMESSKLQAEQAINMAEVALETALAGQELAADQIEIIQPRQASGPALLEFKLLLPAGTWAEGGGIEILDEQGQSIPLLAEYLATNEAGDVIAIKLVLTVTSLSTSSLTWRYVENFEALPDVSNDIPTVSFLDTPFSGCEGEEQEASLVSSEDVPGGLLASQNQVWSLPLCGLPSQVSRRLERWRGLPGTVLVVDAQLAEVAQPENLETIVLSPLSCPSTVEELTWRTFAGTTRTRPARYPVDSWNGQSVDGWMIMHCREGQHFAVSHRVLERTSMAFAPLRHRGGKATLAPLGTIWGESPWHQARRTGGHGIGEVITELVGSQFKPAAPDWSGQHIQYRLLLGEDIEADVLDLFAHPPMVRVGSL